MSPIHPYLNGIHCTLLVTLACAGCEHWGGGGGGRVYIRAIRRVHLGGSGGMAPEHF